MSCYTRVNRTCATQGGYDLTPQQKLKYDMKYIHKGSLMMELYISIRTLMVVITGEGSR